MDELEVLLEVLSVALNTDKAGVAELLKSEDGKVKPEAKEVLTQKLKDHIKEVKTTAMDDGHKKATKTARESLEKEWKETLGIETDKKGVELAKHVQETLEEKFSKDKSGKEITEEAVRKHPLFLSLDRKFEDEKKKFETEKDAAVTAVKKEYEAKETFNDVEKNTLDRFISLNPILSTDPTIAKNQKNILITEMKKYGYSKDGEKIHPLDEKGENLRNEMGHIITFETLVEQTAKKYFEFKKATDRSSAGDAGGKGAGAGAGEADKIVLPATRQELDTMIFAEQDSKKRVALKDAWDLKAKEAAGVK